MIVNKVVLLISTTRAGEEELISEIRGCCLCLATLSPQWLTAERVALAFMLPIQPVPWVSDPVRHPFSLLSWCPEAESLSLSQLRAGADAPFNRLHLTRCTCRGLQVHRPTSVKAPLCKQDFSLLSPSGAKY